MEQNKENKSKLEKVNSGAEIIIAIAGIITSVVAVIKQIKE